ncbi:hypothetical protein PUN4_180131 [Paraburkholderia unamae]|nr:hypothetical protein PUN4_180131 [Paraburkholderia unamae]
MCSAVACGSDNHIQFALDPLQRCFTRGIPIRHNGLIKVLFKYTVARASHKGLD